MGFSPRLYTEYDCYPRHPRCAEWSWFCITQPTDASFFYPVKIALAMATACRGHTFTGGGIRGKVVSRPFLSRWGKHESNETVCSFIYLQLWIWPLIKNKTWCWPILTILTDGLSISSHRMVSVSSLAQPITKPGGGPKPSMAFLDPTHLIFKPLVRSTARMTWSCCKRLSWNMDSYFSVSDLHLPKTRDVYTWCAFAVHVTYTVELYLAMGTTNDMEEPTYHSTQISHVKLFPKKKSHYISK